MPGMADILGTAPNGAPQVNFQAANQFAQTLNPVPPSAPQEGPPTTPQELEQRKSGWQDFITKLQTDPAMRQAAILTATQIMRGPGQGESVAGALGRAIQTGTLAHGFLQGNQTNQAIDLEKLKQQQQLNQSNIQQNAAQTSGLEQQQQFAQEAQPLNMRKAEQQISEGDFNEQNRDLLLQEQLLNNKSDRGYKANLGDYRKALGDKARSGGSGPKTPAGVALFDRQKSAMMASNPQLEGEDPLDYQGRIEGMVLDYNAKNRSTGTGNKVQALKTLIENTDPRAPEYQQYQQQLAAIGNGEETGGAAPQVPNMAAWQKARDSVKVGEKYTGPDGKIYIRKQ